jgi:hypothetical protein
MRNFPSNPFAIVLAAACGLLAVMFSTVTLVSGDYADALTAAGVFAAVAAVALAAPIVRGPRAWRLAAIAISLPVMFVASKMLRRSTRPSSRTMIEPDTRPAFVLDPSRPFVIEFGRGSGMNGLDVLKVSESGLVDLHRRTPSADVERAVLQLPPADVKALADVVNARRITHMGRAYSEPGIADGTQWVLWIEQPPSEKSIYFNNAFPAEIKDFAGTLDNMLARAGLNRTTWKTVSPEQGEDQQKALWARIQPAREPRRARRLRRRSESDPSR